MISIKKILTISLFFSILTTMLVVWQTPPLAAQEGVVCDQEIVVQADDWLSKIAEKNYGDPLAYTVIVEATNAKQATDDTFAQITDPNVIEIGWKLCLLATAETPVPATTETTVSPTEVMTTTETVSPALTTSDVTVSSPLDLVPQHVELYQTLQPIPLITTQFPDFSYDQAYTFQEEWVAVYQNAGHQPIGYKLGLTGEAKPFGATEAVYGRLFGSMLKPEGEVVNLTDFVNGRIEVEIAIYFDQDVTYPTTPEALQASVSQVAPAIELPDLIFADMPNLSWLDLIAENVAPRQLIIGQPQTLDELGVDIDTIKTVATRDGEIINEAPATATMGSQWTALNFLAEKLNERGQQIQAGEVVITGALGPLLANDAGMYEVDYGPLGSITFEIQ